MRSSLEPPRTPLKPIRTSLKVVLELLLDVLEMLLQILDLCWRSWSCKRSAQREYLLTHNDLPLTPTVEVIYIASERSS